MLKLKSLQILLIIGGIYFPIWAQDGLNNQEALKIFLDCDACDFSYIRTHIPYVNYTRDPQFAQVHIKITYQNTGSGGRKYILNFFGQMNFEGMQQKLEYISSQSDSWDMDRKGLTQTIEMGLMPYISQTYLAPFITIEFERDANIQPELNNDPWNNWTFHIDFMGDLDAEQSQNELKLSTELKANHTTDDWKVRSRIKYDYESEKIDDEDEIVKSILRELESDVKIVKSLDDRWSVGLNLGANATTYRNISSAFSLAPAIEYNFYPWSKSDQKILALAYYSGARTFDYMERTIFDKTKETLFFEGMSLQLEIIEPWGEVYIDLSGSHFFHDFTKNQLKLSTAFSMRIVKGFSVKMNLEAERLRDQLYLPQEGASRDEILLKRKKLATDYELSWSFGLEYSFGSIYNNFVNRRL